MKIPAIYVMVTIIRMAPRSFYIHESKNFWNKIKLTSILDFKNTYLDGLKIVYEIIRGYKKMPTSQEQNSGSETLVEIPDDQEDSSKYERHRTEILDNKIIDIMSPRNAFYLVFGDSTAASATRIEMVKNDTNWTEKIKFYYKILMQICVENIEYACQKVIPKLISVAKATKTSEFLVALKVVKELIVNKDLFSMIYSGNNSGINDVNKIIQTMKQVVTSELVDDIKRSTPSFSIYLSTFWDYFNSGDYNRLYQKARVDKFKFEKFLPLDSNDEFSFPNFSLIDTATKRKNILKNKEIMIRLIEQKSRQEEHNQTSYDDFNEIDRSTYALLYLIKIVPLLDLFVYTDSQSSDIIFEEGSSDEINTTLKQETSLLFHSSNQDNELAYSSSSSIKKEIEYMLPYYLLSFSYRISGHVSYMLQKLFIQNEYSRVYILEQISYIIKQTQNFSGTIPKHVVVMYQHLDMLLSYWKDVELSENEQHSLQMINQNSLEDVKDPISLKRAKSSKPSSYYKNRAEYNVDDLIRQVSGEEVLSKKYSQRQCPKCK